MQNDILVIYPMTLKKQPMLAFALGLTPANFDQAHHHSNQTVP